MEIPSSGAGVVKAINVKLGDRVKQGSVVLSVESTESSANLVSKEPVAQQIQAQAAPEIVAFSLPLPPGEGRVEGSSSPAATFKGTADLDCDLLVLGAGPGGYSAAFRAADLGLKVILVER